MSKKQIKTEALNLFNDLLKLGIYTSYRSVLNTMYETATEKNNYIKASYINELIFEDINS